jgi:hypothetical protein
VPSLGLVCLATPPTILRLGRLEQEGLKAITIHLPGAALLDGLELAALNEPAQVDDVIPGYIYGFFSGDPVNHLPILLDNLCFRAISAFASRHDPE